MGVTEKAPSHERSAKTNEAENTHLRRMLVNFGWLIADRGGRLAIGFVVSIAVARHLGPADFGRLSYALSLLALLACIVPLGTDASAKRELITAPARTQELLSTFLALRIASSLFCLVILGACIPLIPESDRMLVYAAAGTILVPVAASFDLLLEARLLGRRSFVARLAPSLASAILRLNLIVFDASLTAFAFATTVEAVLILGSLGVAVRKIGVSFAPHLFSFPTAVSMVRETWPLLLSAVAVTVYGRCDQIMLRHFGSDEMVGSYAAATRFAEVTFIIPVLLASTAYPALVRAQKGGPRKYRTQTQAFYDLNAGIAYLTASLLCFGAPYIIRVAYGSSFASAAGILSIYSWSALFAFLGVARSNILTIEGRTGVQLFSTLSGAIINVAMNLWLIPKLGGIGAAWATVVAQAWAALFALAFTGATIPHFLQLCKALFVPLMGWRYLRANSSITAT